MIQLPASANELNVTVTDAPYAIETEPNDSVEAAHKIMIPQVVHGRFNKPGDSDVFTFSAKKGIAFYSK